jgi:hypothetical protein
MWALGVATGPHTGPCSATSGIPFGSTHAEMEPLLALSVLHIGNSSLCICVPRDPNFERLVCFYLNPLSETSLRNAVQYHLGLPRARPSGKYADFKC